MTEKQANNITYIIAVIVIFVLLIFSSCRTKTVYVPVETTKIEYRDYLQRDSIFLKDSIFLREKGDTILLEKYKYLYRDRLVRDSVFVTDSIQVPYPVEVIKEVNRLKTWQIILMCLGAGMTAVVGYQVWRMIKIK